MTQAYPELLNAVRYLAARCDSAQAKDGQGYNGLDAGFGHSLASCDQWTPRQAYAAYKILLRYRKQLLDGDIDYDALPIPEHVTSKDTSPKRVTLLESGDIAAVSPYDQSLVDWYRDVRAFHWDKVRKCWRAPASPDLIPYVITLRDQWGFDVSDAAAGRLAALATSAQASIEASRAATSDFDVPGLGGTLRPFQRAGVEYLVSHPHCLLTDEMGLGKTVQSLAALKALDAFPALIICPASLKYNWRREAEHWLPGVSVAILNGNGKKNHASDAANPQITVINFDLIWREQYIARLSSAGFKAIIIDESAYIKERKSKRTQVAKEIAKQASVRYLLSGTPILSRPAELVSQLDTAGLLGYFGGAWAFLQRYCDAKQTPWGWDFTGASHLDELNDKLRAVGFIRRTKVQVLPELPPKQYTDFPVNITNRAEYDEAEADIIAYLQTVDWQKASAAERAKHLVKIEVLKQLAATGKMDAVREWVGDFLESGEKLVVFAHHIAVQESLLAAFPQAARIMGEDNPTERQTAVDRFQTDPDCRLIVCSLKAGGVGITLTAASNVLMVEYGWTPSDMSQASDRLHRIGQTDSVNVWQMVGQETIDEEILRLLASKRTVVDAATDGAVKDAVSSQSIAADLVAYLKSKGGAKK